MFFAQAHADKPQEQQPKKKNWAQKMRNPTTLRYLIRWGFTIYNVGKWLIELMEL